MSNTVSQCSQRQSTACSRLLIAFLQLPRPWVHIATLVKFQLKQKILTNTHNIVPIFRLNWYSHWFNIEPWVAGSVSSDRTNLEAADG